MKMRILFTAAFLPLISCALILAVPVPPKTNFAPATLTRPAVVLQHGDIVLVKPKYYRNNLRERRPPPGRTWQDHVNYGHPAVVVEGPNANGEYGVAMTTARQLWSKRYPHTAPADNFYAWAKKGGTINTGEPDVLHGTNIKVTLNLRNAKLDLHDLAALKARIAKNTGRSSGSSDTNTQASSTSIGTGHLVAQVSGATTSDQKLSYAQAVRKGSYQPEPEISGDRTTTVETQAGIASTGTGPLSVDMGTQVSGAPQATNNQKLSYAQVVKKWLATSGDNCRRSH